MSLPAACDFSFCAFSWPPAEFLMWNRRLSQRSTWRLARVFWGLSVTKASAAAGGLGGGEH